MFRIMEKMIKGNVHHDDIDKLLNVTKQIEGHTICALGDAAAWPIQGLMRHFRTVKLKEELKRILKIGSSLMPKIIIDNKEIEFENGMTVMQACELADAEIPRFCYHDKLSIAGNCRMCLS